MNISRLHDVCKTKFRAAFEDYKRVLEDNPFDVINEGIVEDALYWSIVCGNGVVKQMLNEATFTDAQLKHMDSIINDYKQKTITVARRYGLKKCIK